MQPIKLLEYLLFLLIRRNFHELFYNITLDFFIIESLRITINE